MPVLSKYFYSLNTSDQLRYLEEIIPLGGVDPYSIKAADFCKDLTKMPKIKEENINNYLILQISPFTQQEMRAYKSMEAFVKIACKWVKQISFKYIDDYCVVIGKVLHSQRINDTPLRPWIILKNGDITYAHCTCIAGLGETCSHVASILFSLEKTYEKSVTDVFAYWEKSTDKNAEYKTVKDIDWKTPKQLTETRRKLPVTENANIDVPPMSEEEITDM